MQPSDYTNATYIILNDDTIAGTAFLQSSKNHCKLRLQAIVWVLINGLVFIHSKF
jgi:hypothetical protein